MRAGRASDSGLLLAALGMGVSLWACGGQRTLPGTPDSGVSASGGASASGGSGGGAGKGGATAACAGATDPRVVVAPQRVVPLSAEQVLATVRALFGAPAVARIMEKNVLALTPEEQKHFPPAAAESITLDSTGLVPRDAVGQLVGEYVAANFETVTACPTPTDTCALAYLNALASKAYRREPTGDERTALGALYAKLRRQEVNGFVVEATVEEATQYAVHALVMSPQLLWRYETGDPAAIPASTGVSLTEDELASAVSFFLTNGPPDEELRTAARTHTLFTNLDQQLTRLLASPAAREWLRSVMELRFTLNQLPLVTLDRSQWPLDDALIASMQTSSRMFLDEVLWRGRLTDTLTSTVAFVDSRLATEIYGLAPPAGAGPGAFVKTDLPAQQRAGLLTDPALLTGLNRLVKRGVRAARAFMCANMPAVDLNDNSLVAREAQQGQRLHRQTAVEQVTERRATDCAGCHETTDALGLVLDAYDAVGRFRTTGDLGQPVDTRVALPSTIGTGTVDGAVQMADALARNPAFVECMAAAVLQLAASDDRAVIPWEARGSCATADVAARFTGGTEQTFSALVRATAASPAFSLRKAIR